MKERTVLGLLMLLILSFLCMIILSHRYQCKKESFVDNHDKLMFFYADWCPHCKSLKPIVQSIKDNSSLIDIEMLEDASTPSNVKKDFNIQGYPTIYYVHDSKKIKFTGARTKDAIESFVASCRK